MLKLLRIPCIWLCLASCIKSPFIIAVPLEYIDDHEQLSYDMDTEQSKAKYDPRLLTEQLLNDDKEHEETHASYQHHHHHHQQQHRQQQQPLTMSTDEDFQPHGRAASCHSSGIKYTHGQKVPRLDPCEVCLCVDGEIFCWWKKCGATRKKFKAEINLKARQEAASWKSKKFRLTAWKPTATATATTTKHTTKHRRPTSKEQQRQHVAVTSEEWQLLEQQKSPPHAGYKKLQQIFKHQKQQQQQQQLQRQLHVEMQQEREHENMLRQRQQQFKHHTSNKIMSFPENLPSLLYYDYKTEEHQHHQHQHRQQHLKHQQERRQQQHQRKEQQQLEESQSQHEQQPQTANSSEESAATPTTASKAKTLKYPQQLQSNQEQFMNNKVQEKHIEADEEDEQQQQQATDSDILPEPPTKKPKLTAADKTAATTTLTTSSSNEPSKELKEEQLQWQETPTAETKQFFSDNYSLSIRNDNNNNSNTLMSTSTTATKENSESLENIEEMHLNRLIEGDVENSNDDGTIDGDNDDDDVDEDDDFHRWLSSTESYNNKSKVYTEAEFDSKQSTELQPQTPESDVAAEVVNPYAAKLITTSPTNSNINSQRPAHVQTRTHTDTNGHDSRDAASLGGGGGGFFRSSYNDNSSEFNGSVVNIDILLTAGQDEQQKQQQQRQPPFVLQEDLIANASKAAQIATTSTAEVAAGGGDSNEIANASITGTTTTTAAMAEEAAAASVFVDRAPIASNQSSSTAATLRLASPDPVTSIDKQCNVMGTLYKIGDVLPQETGNCLQCICIDGGSTKDDTPRVTCSPHNCPPLVLPDLFDATGY